MTEPDSKTRSRKLGLGIAISLLSIALLIWLSDLEVLRKALRQLPIGLLLVVIILIFISLCTRAFAWRTILLDRVSPRDTFLILNAGYFLNTILPFRAGEIGRAVLLIPHGIKFWEGIPSIFIERMFDLMIAATLFAIGLPTAVDLALGGGYAFLLISLVVLGFGILFAVFYFQDQIQDWMIGSGGRFAGPRNWIGVRLQPFFDGLGFFRDWRRMLRTFFWMLVSWGLALFLQMILLRGFVPDAPVMWGVFALGAVSLGVTVPSSPGNFGVYEGSMTLALTAVGMDPSLAFAYSVTSHAASLLVTSGFGGYSIGKQGYSLKDLQLLTRMHNKEGEI
jgi:uncharacterized protein (TIRG00374 family)